MKTIMFPSHLNRNRSMSFFKQFLKTNLVFKIKVVHFFAALYFHAHIEQTLITRFCVVYTNDKR